MNENEELIKFEELNENNYNIEKNKSLTQRGNFKSYKKSKIKGSYYLGKTLGEGTFGKVKLAIHIKTGEKIAVKIINKEKLINVESNIQNVRKEISILKKLIHKNIIQLYEVMESKNNLYIAMEYCENKELFNYIIKKGKLSEKDSCKIFQQIINGVQYLHQQGICHRDLKPENILLDAKNNIKISDFGLSTFLPKNILLSTPCGTPTYAPPEMLKGEKYNGELSDIWSCGIILFALLNGNVPFEESEEIFVYKKIIQSGISGLKFSKGISNDAKDLIHKMLKIEPKERININDIIHHKWFTLVENSMKPGIDLKSKQNFPIDDNILKEVGKYGYNVEECRMHLNMNKYDSLTTIYRLLMRKYVMKGGTSIGDLNSQTYLNYIKSINVISKDNSKLYELENEIKKKKKIEKKVNSFFKNINNYISSLKNKINISSDKNNFILNKKKFCENKYYNLKNNEKDNNEIKINFKQIQYNNSKINFNKKKNKLIESEKLKLIKKNKIIISSGFNNNQKKFKINKCDIIQFDDDDLQFENELKKMNSNSSNVKLIKIMAQKLLNSSSFNSSFNFSSNKYLEKKKNIYLKEYKYDENKNLNLIKNNFKNYYKIETNKLKTHKRYISNKQLIKKNDMFVKKKFNQIKKRNNFFDISTTQFDSFMERTSSFNKSKILNNSSKRMNQSNISMPFFSQNLIDRKIKFTNNKKKIKINNVKLPNKKDKKRIKYSINEKESNFKYHIETTMNKYQIGNIKVIQKIKNQKNNKSNYYSNNNSTKSIIGLFKSRIPLIKNDKCHTINTSPIILNKNIKLYFTYKNEKKKYNYKDNNDNQNI